VASGSLHGRDLSLSNSTDALNPPFTALGESTRAFAPNARQFVRLGFGDRFGAQAPISAQAPSRAASFFRAVEGRPDRGRFAASENKEPRRSGARGGTSFGVFGPPWGRGSRGGSHFALIRTISHPPAGDVMGITFCAIAYSPCGVAGWRDASARSPAAHVCPYSAILT